MQLKDFFWETFIRAGNIESYFAYRECANAVINDINCDITKQRRELRREM